MQNTHHYVVDFRDYLAGLIILGSYFRCLAYTSYSLSLKIPINLYVYILSVQSTTPYVLF
jgi:uncharacterized membrane protein YoaT (DUF817 family)